MPSLQIPPQFRYKRIYSTPYPISGAQNASTSVAVPIELTKYVQTDYISRLLVRVSGTIAVVTNGTTALTTGKDNPEALLVSAMLQTTPSLNGVTPVNNVSARGILVDGTFMRGYTTKAPYGSANVATTAVAGFLGTGTTAQMSANGTSGMEQATAAYVVDTWYELYFKRPYVRKGGEYDFAIGNYSSALLTLMFGGREQLYTAGTDANTWNCAGLTVSIYVDSDLNSVADRIHNSEFFERTYPITATQTDFPIDTLPQGFLYSDLCFIAEVNNARSNAVINNINIEGGGRVWLGQGEANGPLIRRVVSRYRGIISDPSYDDTGIYPIPLRDGMFTKAIDSLSSPITIKLDVTTASGALVRLIGRKLVPGQHGKSNPNTKY